MNDAHLPIDAVPVILAGGSGSRLWPLSRAGHPKQFLALQQGSPTLFQQATQRLLAARDVDIGIASPLVVANDDVRFMAREQLHRIGVAAPCLLLEPSGRNTAPAITLAALQATLERHDPVLVVSPADQTVNDAAAFTRAIKAAIREAARGSIVVLGIAPTQPETGYGYLQAGPSDAGCASVRRFVEKPDEQTARRYLAEGDFFWNGGSFVMRASVWLDALRRFRPDILATTTAAFAARRGDGDFVRPDAELFAAVPAESADYAVLEHCPGSEVTIRMVGLDAGWSDLGAWDAVWQASPKDGDGNVVVGDVLLDGSRDSLVNASSRLVGVIGLDNVVVVETPDAVLVADRGRTQDVKTLVARLNENGRPETAAHRKVHRPWGWYDSIDTGPRFQVKRILVHPGASLSLQMHHHRAEHWIVVSGTAEVTCGDKVMLLTENQSTYIPLGATHRLVNPGKLPLEIIEVQSGAYLGEDDIVRFGDSYGRG